jgi:hypothetical protein
MKRCWENEKIQVSWNVDYTLRMEERKLNGGDDSAITELLILVEYLLMLDYVLCNTLRQGF